MIKEKKVRQHRKIYKVKGVKYIDEINIKQVYKIYIKSVEAGQVSKKELDTIINDIKRKLKLIKIKRDDFKIQVYIRPLINLMKKPVLTRMGGGNSKNIYKVISLLRVGQKILEIEVQEKEYIVEKKGVLMKMMKGLEKKLAIRTLVKLNK